MTAHFQYTHPPKAGMQTLVYRVWDGIIHRFAWVTVSCAWLREGASLNDLKSIAIAQVQKATTP